MENRQHILAELQEIGPLVAGLPAVCPYKLPENYFEGFAASVIERIQVEKALAAASAPVYSVPQGYFEGLAAQVMSKIKTSSSEVYNELEEVAPLLNTISKQNPFQVPAGYFESLKPSVSQPEQKPARVITMRRANKWMQYAVAAMMSGILVTGAFLFTDNKTNINIENNEGLDITSELNKMNANELVTYLNNPDHAIAAPATTTLATESDLEDVRNTISKMSDDELNDYLKENAGPFDSVIEKE